MFSELHEHVTVLAGPWNVSVWTGGWFGSRVVEDKGLDYIEDVVVAGSVDEADGRWSWVVRKVVMVHAHVVIVGVAAASSRGGATVNVLHADWHAGRCCQRSNVDMITLATHRLNLLCITTYVHPFNGPLPGTTRWAGTRKVKPIWILLEQETVSGSGISWAICKSAPRSRQITMPAPHHSVCYRPDALPAAQPTVSKHWRLCIMTNKNINK